MGLLIIFTLILALLALFMTIILYKRQNQLFALEKKYEQLNEELKDTVASFFMQMQEENDTFIKKLRDIQTNPVQEKNDIPKQNKQTTEDVSPSLQGNENNTQDSFVNIKTPPLYAGINIYKQQQENGNRVHSEEKTGENAQLKTKQKTEVEQIKEFLNAGQTVEEIAKNMDKGKTEVELLIKFTPELQEEKY